MHVWQKNMTENVGLGCYVRSQKHQQWITPSRRNKQRTSSFICHAPAEFVWPILKSIAEFAMTPGTNAKHILSRLSIININNHCYQPQMRTSWPTQRSYDGDGWWGKVEWLKLRCQKREICTRKSTNGRDDVGRERAGRSTMLSDRGRKTHVVSMETSFREVMETVRWMAQKLHNRQLQLRRSLIGSFLKPLIADLVREDFQGGYHSLWTVMRKSKLSGGRTTLSGEPLDMLHNASETCDALQAKEPQKSAARGDKKKKKNLRYVITKKTNNICDA